MKKYVCVKTSDCESARRILAQAELIDSRRKFERDTGEVCVPIVHTNNRRIKSVLKDIKFFLKKLRGHKQELVARNVKELLIQKLSEEEAKKIGSSYDIIGGIILVELPEKISKNKEKAIAECFLKFHKNAKTVAAKAGIHSGIKRLQKVRIIAGKKRLVTIHKENGIRLKLHVGKTYFSARLANERKRIIEQIKSREEVIIMFSGAGPYLVGIAKNAKPKRVVGVEINKDAHKMAIENIKINKVKAEAYCGDVRKYTGKIGKFDRIIMPLPKGADGFFVDALKMAKDSAIINYYFFCKENELEKECERELNRITRGLKGLEFKILNCVACGAYSPGITRACIDIIAKKIK